MGKIPNTITIFILNNELYFSLICASQKILLSHKKHKDYDGLLPL